MVRFLRDFLLAALFGTFYSNAQPNFPIYEAVVSHVDTSVDARCADCFYTLAKKETGYSLVLSRGYDDTYELLESIPVWDAGSGEFLPIHIPEHYQEAPDGYGNGLDRLLDRANNYDFYRYQGYPNWSLDIIEILGKREDLSAQEMEQLARAHSYVASSYIHPRQYGNELTLTEGLTDPIYASVSKKRVKQFLTHARKSLACLEQIAKNYPDYEGFIIPDMDVKIAHDRMHCYQYLMSVLEPKKARSFLNDTEYNAAMRHYAKTTLDACAENAVIFTHGDSDTYPLWYLQAAEHYRTDVIVLNSSLLQTEWYTAMMRETHALNVQLDRSDFGHLNSYYIEVKDTLEEIWTEQWISDLKRLGADTLRMQEPDFFPSIPRHTALHLADSSIEFDIRNRYLRFADVLIYDLINSNPQRGFYTTSPHQLISLGLGQFCKLRGTSYELTVDDDWYVDELSIETLGKSLAALNEDYVREGNDQAVVQLMMHASFLNFIGTERYQEEAENLISEFNAKFSDAFIVSLDDLDLFRQVSRMKLNRDPASHDAFTKALQSLAVEKIGALKWSSAYSSDFIRTIECIMGVFGQVDNPRMLQSTENLAPHERAVLRTLLNKLNELNAENPVLLKWTSADFSELRLALELTLR